MSGARETALYYSPEKGAKARKVKSVLARLGIRIKNIVPEQMEEQVGTLAGLEDFSGKWSENAEKTQKDTPAAMEQPAPDIKDYAGHETEEMLVLCNFTESSLDRLLRELRKSNASVTLKAVLTETNSAWSFRRLCQEVREEHERMTGQA